MKNAIGNSDFTYTRYLLSKTKQKLYISELFHDMKKVQFHDSDWKFYSNL